MSPKTRKWLISVLSNDEVSTDEELVELIKTEAKISHEAACAWVGKRDFYLNNIVMDDGSIYDPRNVKHVNEVTIKLGQKGAL